MKQTIVLILWVSAVINCALGITERELAEALTSPEMMKRGVLKEVECISCRAGMGSVASIVNDVLKRVALKKLKKRCSEAKKDTTKAMCEKFADKDGHQMADLLVNFLNPETFCPVIDACDLGKKRELTSSLITGAGIPNEAQQS